MEPTRATLSDTHASHFAQMEAFDRELERFESQLTALEHELEPIRRRVDRDALVEKMIEEAPTHDLHERIIRLGRLNQRLEDVRGSVEL